MGNKGGKGASQEEVDKFFTHEIFSENTDLELLKKRVVDPAAYCAHQLHLLEQHKSHQSKQESEESKNGEHSK